ncbi:unnamed protein product [Cladocopium goreaui]|uniref:Pentatricopeptide repeat-containing protein GUN1, chloroplastic (Pentatricopeptide repeat-containing protein At2g31400) (Protein GENOMES UNCOUPLED 1) n=1 Tax=Cladocopium goreaui TaxID=2562237 RepID=A0A9P1GIJ7_9DINO|nr:unnamed protein product [Cladocopium goreaui]
MALFHAISEVALSASLVSYNTAISASDKSGHWPLAQWLLRHLPTGLQPDSISYFCNMRAARWWDALKLFEEMVRLRVQPDSSTFNKALTAAGEAVLWQCTMKLLKETPVEQDAISIAVATTAFSRRSRWREGLQLWSSDSNEEQLGAMLNACAEAEQWRWGLEVFDLVLLQALEPNAFHCSAALRARGTWQGALGFFRGNLLLGVSQNVFSCSSLLDACASGCSAWQNAVDELGWMLRVGIWDSFVADLHVASWKCCDWTWALEAMAMNALHFPVTPGSHAVAVTLTALEKAVQWLQSMHLLAATMSTTVVSLNAAISAVEKVGYWRRALPMLTQMLQMTLKPDSISCSAAVSACEQQGQWRRATHLLQSGEASLVSGAGAISAIEKALRWSSSVALLAGLAADRVGVDKVCVNAALRCLERQGRWRKMLQLMKAMTEARLAPDILGLNSACLACEASADCATTLRLLQETESCAMAAIWEHPAARKKQRLQHFCWMSSGG